jgi:hypothetical protein
MIIMRSTITETTHCMNTLRSRIAESHLYHEYNAITHYRNAPSHEYNAITHCRVASSHDNNAITHYRAASSHDHNAVIHCRAASSHDNNAITHYRAAPSHKNNAITHKKTTAPTPYAGPVGHLADSLMVVRNLKNYPYKKFFGLPFFQER